MAPVPPAGLPVHHAPPRCERPSLEPARIVVPLTRLHPDTAAALAPFGDRVRYIDVSPPGWYWELFRDLWRAGEDFILVEHDIVPGPQTIARFDECRGSWCTCPYLWHWKGTYPWVTDRRPKVLNGDLGCTRFRAEVMTATPELGDDAILGELVENWRPGLPLPYWLVDDVVRAVLLERRHFAFCEHERVGHRG
jgi:hypothetical protein